MLLPLGLISFDFIWFESDLLSHVASGRVIISLGLSPLSSRHNETVDTSRNRDVPYLFSMRCFTVVLFKKPWVGATHSPPTPLLARRKWWRSTTRANGAPTIGQRRGRRSVCWSRSSALRRHTRGSCAGRRLPFRRAGKPKKQRHGCLQTTLRTLNLAHVIRKYSGV